MMKDLVSKRMCELKNFAFYTLFLLKLLQKGGKIQATNFPPSNIQLCWAAYKKKMRNIYEFIEIFCPKLPSCVKISVLN